VTADYAYGWKAEGQGVSGWERLHLSSRLQWPMTDPTQIKRNCCVLAACGRGQLPLHHFRPMGAGVRQVHTFPAALATWASPPPCLPAHMHRVASSHHHLLEHNML
jgi:hypothetical protein